LSDTSFQIAINELRKVRDDLRGREINLTLRCLFVEIDDEAFFRLQEYVNKINDIQIKLIHGSFEDTIPEIVQFAKADNNMFTFTFIDPTGWKGFRMNNIRPLLKLPSSEVLINFMTDFIIRFIDDKRQEIKDTFIDLFGTEKVQEQWKELKGRKRELLSLKRIANV
jgi:three-Cys-motif partner protein